MIGLGSNLGDRMATLRAAVARVEAFADVLARSRVYETSPVGGPPQADFLNAAILVTYAGAPATLLAELHEVEASLDRRRDVRWGPRTIDLDVLWIAGVLLEGPVLTVPHPRLTERAFALAPLLDVVPGAIDPRTSRPFDALPIDGTVRAVAARL